MNYNSFLKKDYKNHSLSSKRVASLDWQKPPHKLRRFHLVVMLSLLALISSVIIFVSNQTEGNHSSLKDNKINSSNDQITVDLKLNYNDKVTYVDSPDILTDYSNQKPEQINLSTINKDRLVSDKIKLEKTDLKSRKKSLFSELVWTTHKVKSGESLSLIFKKSKLKPSELHDIISLGKATKELKSLRPGQEIKFRTSANGELQELIYIQNSQNSLHVMKFSNGYQAIPIQKTIEKRITHAKVEIHNSLFEAGQAAGLSTTLIMDLAGIFGWDIDFALDIRVGDQFSVVYEEHYLEGKKIRDGAILAAEFINQKRRFQAIRFTDKHNRTDYYTPTGLSMRKAFLRTPVDFRRISSRFGRRKHPVLNYMRLHKGVDYAARRGTPVRASGDGKIVHKRRKGGYGRAIVIKHGSKYSTLYAHLQSYKKGLYVGKKVKQGQTIGYVGSSGRTTGPHLHYEFRVHGTHRNPLTVKLPNAQPINKAFKEEYLSYAIKMIAQLESYNQFTVALNP